MHHYVMKSYMVYTYDTNWKEIGLMKKCNDGTTEMIIFPGIHVNILYAKAGEVNDVVINRIVGAKVRYV